MNDCKINKKKIYEILCLCILSIVICVIKDISLIYAFVVGIIYTTIVSLKSGFKLKEIKSMAYEGVKECSSLYLIILLIGATVSVWLSSGVVPTMIYYGLEYMQGVNFLFASFMLISISAIFMGTAVGTISTIGVAILGIGKGFGIPMNILVGVIVSGAFLADKISPISGLLNLTLATTEINYKEAIKSAIYTMIPTMIICAIIYYIIGIKYEDSVGINSILELKNAMGKEFFISPYLLFLPIVIIILSIIGIKSSYCMFSGIIVGSIVTCFFQKIKVLSLLKYIIFGFNANSTSTIVNETLISGGMISMVSVIFIVIGAIALTSILQGTGIISYLTKDIIQKITSRKDLILKTGVISSILTVITCDQTMGIVLPSKLLKEKYKKLGVNKSILARTISDTGTIIAPIIPWNINALIVNLVTGISCTEYFRFALLCFVAPIVTIVFAFINTGNYKKQQKIESVKEV
ncbi:sodium:proton antiporter [Romboutsia maritimum]|uniref:Sodium:proton antiporter n=1 Tax=Romboutsia maritimum TaxID=2020948 RepID=A0A371IS70_9FIRM|nr:Na+/H+ antiporter NhaC family protein [Romboutsia maritimum]RDY23340.1 sodium:proton antiporter [Romboutsia maritimum]